MRLTKVHYGWVMTILGISSLASFAVIIYTFGIFLVPLTTGFGWERGELSAALSITTLVGGCLGIITGRISDRYGPRPLVTVGGLTAGTGLFLMARINFLWQVYLIWGALMGIAWACFTIPVTSTIPRWFIKRRGVAQGLTMTGMGLGGLIWPPSAQWLISSLGWQRAYVILGLVILLISVPLAQFMKHSPQRVGLRPYGENITVDKQSSITLAEGLTLKQTVRTERFWIFGTISFAFLFCIQSVVVHIAPHASDIGILAMAAASIPAIFAASSLIGRLSIGSISDRAGPRPALTACLVLFTLALTLLLFAKEVWMLYVFAVMYGIAYGGETAVTSLVPAELFGLKYLGTIAATTFLFGTTGASIGPFLAGTIFDITGSYHIAFLICVILSALAIIFSLILLRSKSYLATITPI